MKDLGLQTLEQRVFAWNDVNPAWDANLRAHSCGPLHTMLETIIVILVVMWLLGFFAFHIGSGLIHILLVIAVVVLIVRLLGGGTRTTV